MSELDDLIAEAGRARGRSELDDMIAQAGRAQQEEQLNASAPSFIGYQPPPPPQSSDDPAKPDVWAQLRAARERMGGGAQPIEQAAEAGVGSILPGGGASLAGRMAAGAAGGAGMSALASARDAMQGGEVDPRAAAIEAGRAGAFGAAGGAVSGLVAKGARGVADLAQRGYKSARNLVAGQAVRDAQAQAAMHGVDAIDENFGGLLDRHSPSSGTGKSARSHHAVVNAEKDRVGKALRKMQKQIQSEVVQPDVSGAGSLIPDQPGTIGQARERFAKALGREAAASGGTLARDQQGYASELSRMRQELLGTPGKASFTPRTTSRPEQFFPDEQAAAAYDQQRAVGLGSPPSQPEFRPVFEDDAARAASSERQRLGLEPRAGDIPYNEVQRTPGREPLRSFDDFPGLIGEKSRLQSYAHSGPGQSVPEAASKKAAAFAGSTLKDEARRIVEQARPELASRYVAENQNFAELATLEEMLRNKAVREGTGGDFGSTLASSALAGVAGAGAGALVSDDPVTGALIGGGSGFAGGLGLTGGATRTAARQALGSRGADWGANMLRSIGSGSGRVAQALQNINAGAGAARVAGRFGGESQPEQPGAQVAVGQSRVEELARTNPQALGPYASLLQGAANDPQRLRAVIANLSEREPMFRRMLRQLEQQQQPAADSGSTFSLEQP